MTRRTFFPNGCEQYKFESALDKDGKERTYTAFPQELELVDRGLNAPAEKPIERKKTGGPSSRQSFFEKM